MWLLLFLRNNDDNTVNTIVCSYNSNDCYTDNNSNDFKSKARIKVKNYIADQSALQARMVETLTNIQQIRCMRIENMLSDSLKQDYKHLIKRLRERVQISDIMESVVGLFNSFFIDTLRYRRILGL